MAASWYKKHRKCSTLVLVEDQFSAIKLGQHVHTLSLMGTHLSEEKVEEILLGDYKKVFICLDADATRDAIVLQHRWRRVINGLQVYALRNKDIKDMNEDEIDSVLFDLQQL